MSILAKLVTAMKGAATEAGEAVVDQQALRILDQEMRDAEKQLGEAKGHLTSVMAQRRGVQREIERLTSAVSEHEGYAAAALDKGDEGLAGEVCEKIAGYEEELGVQRGAAEQLDKGLGQLKQTIKTTERNIAAMKRQVNMVKATEKVQKASAAASQRFSGTSSSLGSATDSLERIKKRQQERSDRMDAAAQLHEESDGADLDRRLKEAGITKSGASGSDVLARLKAKAGGGS